jgi:hypothetical protein
MTSRMFIYRILLLFCIILFSCNAPTNTGVSKRTRISVQAGINQGGIVENTDFSIVPSPSSSTEATVDAFTGATQTGFNGGVHVNHALSRNQVETGLDYMFNHHTFNYIDEENHFVGVRRIGLSQIMLPLTYNFEIIRKIDLQFKFGLAAQYNLINVNDVTVFNLPDYKIHRLSVGPTFGISAFPVRFASGSKLGLYFDMYRGSQIYEDYFNQTSFEIPGSSYVKCGFMYQF